MVGHGVPLKSIAREMGVAQRTVERYRTDIARNSRSTPSPKSPASSQTAGLDVSDSFRPPTAPLARKVLSGRDASAPERGRPARLRKNIIPFLRHDTRVVFDGCLVVDLLSCTSDGFDLPMSETRHSNDSPFAYSDCRTRAYFLQSVCGRGES